MMFKPDVLQVRSMAAVAAAAALLASMPTAQARVVRMVVDSTTPSPGQAIAYEQVRGRAFGELDPNDPHNAIITDIQLGKDADGKVRYEATFTLTKPVDMSAGERLHVARRAESRRRDHHRRAERNLGDIGLASAWQADNAGATAVPTNHATGSNHWVAVPMAKNPTARSSPATCSAASSTAAAPTSQPLNVMGNPIPYLPADARHHAGDADDAHARDGQRRRSPRARPFPNSDWAFAHCDATAPFPGRPTTSTRDLPGNLPVHVCLRNGFDPTCSTSWSTRRRCRTCWASARPRSATSARSSATRRRTTSARANPLAGKSLGDRSAASRSRATSRAIHLSRHEPGRASRIVHEGAWPIIAGRRVANNSRWGQPDGVLELYQMGSEGPQWWVDWPDTVRDLPTRGILDRCNCSGTCPKIDRALRRLRSVRAEDDDGVGRHRSPKYDIPLPATCAATTCQHDARRRRRRLRRRTSRRHRRELSGQQLGPRHASARTRCRRRRSST